MKWVGIQRNPRSGAGGQHPRLMELIAGLREYGLRPRLYSRPDELDAAVADPERRENLHGLIAAGGDGTLLHLINRHGDIPIGLLPLGTENLVAHYLKVPRNGRTVAKIVAEGHQQRFDVGRLGTQRFLVMASAGIDAEIIRRAHAQRTGHITRAAYVAPILAALGYYAHPELRVYVDDDPTPVVGRIVVAANLPMYALGLRVVPTARPDDGLLDIRVFQGGTALQVMRYFALLQTGAHEHVADVVHLQARKVRIESESPVPVQIDGDPAGETPVDVSVDPSACQLFVPESFRLMAS